MAQKSQQIPKPGLHLLSRVQNQAIGQDGMGGFQANMSMCSRDI